MQFYQSVLLKLDLFGGVSGFICAAMDDNPRKNWNSYRVFYENRRLFTSPEIIKIIKSLNSVFFFFESLVQRLQTLIF